MRGLPQGEPPIDVAAVARPVGRLRRRLLFAPPRPPGAELGMAAAYLLASVIGRATALMGGGVALIWPAAGVSMLWLAPYAVRRWRGAAPALTILVICSLATTLATGASPGMALAFTLANLTMGVVSAQGLARSAGRAADRLDSPTGLYRLFHAVLTAALLSATVGSLALGLVVEVRWLTAVEWAFRNCVSGMVAGVIWYGLVRRDTRVDQETPASTRPVVVAVVVALHLLIWSLGDPVLLFLLMPATMLAALRTDALTTGRLTCTLAVAEVLSTLAGVGPLSALPPSSRCLIAQAFVLVLIMVGMTIALDRDERGRLQHGLQLERGAGACQAELLQRILSSLGEGVVLVEADGTVDLGNRAAQDLLDLPEGFVGVSSLPESLFATPRDAAAAATAPLNRVLGGERGVRRDILVERPDGAQRIVAVDATPMDCAEGDLAVAILRDVTEERRRTEELSAFAGTVAHDLRNPLTALRCWLEVLEDDYGDDPGVADIARRLLGSADRMNMLIEDILSYSVSRGGDLESRALHLHTVVSGALDATLDRVGTGPAPTFRCDVDTWVQADPAALAQVLGNVLGNSLKYTPRGAVADIAITAESAGAGLVRLTIADRGPGVPAGQETLIFDEFHRVPETAGEHVGTGLGLAICRRIVERHGGSIAARNRDGGGLAVDIVLPLGDPSPADVFAVVAEQRAGAARAREAAEADVLPFPAPVAAVVDADPHPVVAACRARLLDADEIPALSEAG